MDVNYELYKVFYYVAKHLSFSAASKDLFISQSAISQSIRTLEKKLDILLFVRNTKKVALTYEGQLLFSHIEPAINLIKNGQTSILEIQTLSQGKLHIGANDTICRYYLVEYLKTFHEVYPKINIQVTNRTSIDCIDLLTQGIVDLIIINLPNNHINNNMTILPVKDFSDVFVANNDYAHLNHTQLSLNNLIDFPILMLEKNTSTSEYIYKLFKEKGLDIQPAIELGNIDLLIDLAKIGLGISFVPNYCLNQKETELFTLALKENLPERQLGIVTNKKVPLSISSQKFIEMLTSKI